MNVSLPPRELTIGVSLTGCAPFASGDASARGPVLRVLRLSCWLAAMMAIAQPLLAATVTLTAPPEISTCDRFQLTSTVASGSTTLSNLIITNTLPSSDYVYVPGQTVITLPGSTLSAAAADPTIVGGTTLVWDLRSAASASSVSHLLITEVYYNPAESTLIEGRQWIELYNPTAAAISIANWSLRDAAPGKTDALPSMTVAAGEFVIVAASEALFRAQFPAYAGQLFEIKDNSIGSGLNGFGDGVFLVDDSGATVDGMSYGTSTTAFSPAIGTVAQGHSIARSPANLDANIANDWVNQASPNPGSGNVPAGLQPGSTVQITYSVDALCGAVGGQFFSRASYEQPPGSAYTAQSSAYVTANPGAITVTLSPLVQSAGVGDLATWILTVENSGYGNVRNVVITDTLGAGLSFRSFSSLPALVDATASNTVAVWDSSTVPALADIAAGGTVSVTVSAEVIDCAELYNRADGRWGCDTNLPCQNTADSGRTVTAAIDLINRAPQVSASLAPAGAVPIPYCGGTNVTLTVSNAAGALVCDARNMLVSSTIPPGWSITNDSIDAVGVMHLGRLAPGTSTNLTIRLVPGGDCPLPTTAQPIFFTFAYTDVCGNPYSRPITRGTVRVSNLPGAAVSQVLPETVAGTSLAFPVQVLLAYSNFVGTESITLTDTYPASPNLTPANISGGGTVVGGTIVWSGVSPPPGSGVYTQSFEMLIADPCGGPSSPAQNRIDASDFSDCLGCPRQVDGSGTIATTQILRGDGCPTGGTGGCGYGGSKSEPTPTLAEVCTPVTLTHTFSSFTGDLSDWTGVSFTSDLGAPAGHLAGVESVSVRINGTDVTADVAISGTSPLAIDLSPLNATSFSNLTTVTDLVVRWEVEASEPGRVAETSSLSVPACGGHSATRYWNVGDSELLIDLEPLLSAEACGIVTGRLDLLQVASPSVVAGSQQSFPAYDVHVLLDLDADRNGASTFAYVPGSTVFTNMLAADGSPISGFDPDISDTQLVWTIGGLATNGAGTVTYLLRSRCDAPDNDKQAASVAYNTRCDSGSLPPRQRSVSETNAVPLVYPRGNLLASVQPAISYLTDTQLVNRLHLANSGAAPAYNVTATLAIPDTLKFGSGSIAPTTSDTTNSIWTFQVAESYGGLVDADGDGQADDLPSGAEVDIVVTTYVGSCTSPQLSLTATHGCLGESCQSAVESSATFLPGVGSVVTRTTLPNSGSLCAVTNISLGVRNSGLVAVYDVQTRQELPTGISFVSGSGLLVISGVPQALPDPSGSGTAADPLRWRAQEVPVLARLSPGEEVAFNFDVAVSGLSQAGANPFRAYSEYDDACGVPHTTTPSTSILTVTPPSLSLTKTASSGVLDKLGTNVYTITIAHNSGSVDVPAMQLEDELPTGFTFLHASPPPDLVEPGRLVWSNATLMAATGDHSPPFAASENPIILSVTGVVTTCTDSLANWVRLSYGCDDVQRYTTNAVVHTARSTPSLASGASSSLTLGPGGGTRVLSITNTGGTAVGIIITNTAPPGYIFTHASAAGEFTADSLTLALSGTPVGSIAVIDLASATGSGAMDARDDAGDGPEALDLGIGGGFTLTLNLQSDGTLLDTLADPTDLDFMDPEPPPTQSRASSSTVRFASLCGDPYVIAPSLATIPEQPNADIDIQPNNVVVSTGETVRFTVTIANGAEVSYCSNLYARLRFGAGWSHLACISTSIVQHSSGTVTMEQVGNTNVLINLPGIVLDPLNDAVVLTFEATGNAGAGPLSLLAEVVSDVGYPEISGFAPANQFGELPLADTMEGQSLGRVLGRYASFDQDQTYGVGYSLQKTVRLSGSPLAGASSNVTARVGEPITYHLDALFFGTTFSNVFITESFPANAVFGTPEQYTFYGSITNAVYDPDTGIFTLEPTVITNNPSSFSVDIPACVTNRVENQDGTIVTNLAVSAFDVFGFTNGPLTATATFQVLEPNLQVVKTTSSGTNAVQSGDVIVFTNTISHTAFSSTSAYDVAFSDTLPSGLTFDLVGGTGLDNDGLDNDGDGLTDGGDPDGEGSIVGQTFTVSGANNPALAVLAPNASVRLACTARVLNQALGQAIVNTGTITYTSLPGDLPRERTGADGAAGALDNYATSGSVSMQSRSIVSVGKTNVWSSQSNTVAPDLAVGERAQYRIHMLVPQGVVTNLTITDLVPAGMDWVGTNSDSSLSFPGAGYRFEVPAGGPVFATTTAAGLGISDSDPTPASSTEIDGSGADITFTIPAVTNAPDGDSENDYFDLLMEFVILDEARNVGWGASRLSDSNGVRVTDSTTNYTMYATPYRVAEPRLLIYKSATPRAVDAGDLITNTIIISNRLDAGSAAYDIVVQDVLTNTMYDAGSFSNQVMPANWSWSTTTLAGGLRFQLSSDAGTALAPGQTVTNIFSIRVAQSVTPGARWTNLAQIVASDPISGPSPVGMPVRIGVATNSTALTGFAVTNLLIAKSLSATDATGVSDSAGRNVQIGETVTYALTVTLPESTVTNLAVTDYLPMGLRYVASRVDTNGLGGLLAWPASVTGGSTGGAPVTLTFSGASVVASNNVADNQFTAYIDAVVLNTNWNVGLPGTQTTLTNRSGVTFTGGGTVLSGTVVVTNVEPQLAITKRLSGPVGGVVTVDITVTNSGRASAYDVCIRDPISSSFFQTPTLSSTLVPAGFQYEASGSPGNAEVLFRADPAAGQPANAIDPGDSLHFQFRGTLVPEIAGPVANTATIVTNTTVAGTAAHERFEPPVSASDTLVLPTDLAVLKSVSVTNPPQGSLITYTVVVTNLGAYGATGVRVTDLFPAAVSATAVTPSQGSYTAGTGNWTVGALPVNGGATLSATVLVLSGYGGVSVTNTATLAALDQTDTNAANNTATAVHRVPSADLSLRLAVDNSAPCACTCSSVQYTLTVSNAGPDTATGVIVQNTCALDGIVSPVIHDGGASYVGGLWSVGSLLPGARAVLHVTADVVGLGAATNVAEIAASDQWDPNSTPANQAPAENDRATAVVANNNIDTDGDGMPDWWEVQYGLNRLSGVDATADLDVDGVNNRDEYIGGTDPANSASTPGIVSVQKSGSNDVVVALYLGSNRVFRLDAADAVTGARAAQASFSPVVSGPASWTDVNAVAVRTQRFYRVVASCGGQSFTNTAEFAMIQPTTAQTPCSWTLLGPPVDLAPYNNLNAELGRQLGQALSPAPRSDSCSDMVFVMQNGVWKEYYLTEMPTATNWWDTTADQQANAVIPPAGAFWVKRRCPDATASRVVWTGKVYATPPTIRINTGWTLFSWPLPTAGRHQNVGASTPADQLGFLAAGAKGGTTGAAARADGDELWMWVGTRWRHYWLIGMGNANYDGRWWDDTTGQFADFTLEPGSGYYYRHRGSGFNWTPHN